MTLQIARNALEKPIDAARERANGGWHSEARCLLAKTLHLDCWFRVPRGAQTHDMKRRRTVARCVIRIKDGDAVTGKQRTNRNGGLRKSSVRPDGANQGELRVL